MNVTLFQIVPSLVSVPPPNSASAKTIITFNFKCEHPDIILVENLDDINTNALVLHVSLKFINNYLKKNCLIKNTVFF